MSKILLHNFVLVVVVSTIFSPILSQDYLDHLSMEEKLREEMKLWILGTCDPYSATAALFKSMKVVTFLQKL